jgi:GNAT superfamily N-acetyltransferase
MELLLDRHSSAEALASFECGIKEMDNFIHHSLAQFLFDHKNQLFIVRDMNETIVAMFVLSEGFFFDDNNAFEDMPAYGKPFAILDKRTGTTKFAKRYSTVEIEYLAVNKDLRNAHIGTSIIRTIANLAKSQNTQFITVDAYCTIHYSAVPFYEKCNFKILENQDRTYDTVRMLYVVDYEN